MKTPDQREEADLQSLTQQLATLQTRLVDALAGFEKLKEKAEPELRPIVDDYAKTHARHEKQLASRLAELGHQPDNDGSFFSVIQKAVIETRSWFDDVGTNLVPQILDGEERILGMYSDLHPVTQSESDRSMLERQEGELRSLNARTRSQATA